MLRLPLFVSILDVSEMSIGLKTVRHEHSELVLARSNLGDDQSQSKLADILCLGSLDLVDRPFPD